ncbi:MAG: hypothetical protein HHJ11_10950 [Phycicoccus sp.]|nr:hypothetical protein [Phycicoccus sp.]NMM33318.1 hypothetical protein [Phycicoccus sp.]
MRRRARERPGEDNREVRQHHIGGGAAFGKRARTSAWPVLLADTDGQILTSLSGVKTARTAAFSIPIARVVPAAERLYSQPASLLRPTSP